MKRLLLLLLTVLVLFGCTAKDKYYAIDHFYMKEEGEAFEKAVKDFTVDMYDWYQSVEGEDGVYIIHYDHFSKALLEDWKNSGYMKNVPENDLNYYVASVNYLEDRGLSLSEEEKQMVSNGVRLYLLPESLSESEAETMKAYLTEEALYGFGGGYLIDTIFQKEQKIEFRTYRFDGTFEVPGSEDVKDPVIFVAGCQNMKYFESESLIATGKNDSYIKLTEEAYKKYAKDLPQELKDRKVTFMNISKIKN